MILDISGSQIALNERMLLAQKRYRPLFNRVRKNSNLSCPAIISRYVIKGIGKQAREKEIAWLVQILVVDGVRFLKDGTYQHLTSEIERNAISIEERLELPIEYVFGYLYTKLKLMIDEISLFLQCSPQIVIELLNYCEIERRENDTTRSFVPVVEDKEEDESSIPQPEFLEEILKTEPAILIDTLVDVPLYRDMDTSEALAIKNSISYHLHNNNIFGAFLAECSRYKLLTAEEECILANRIARGDKVAKDQLICSNLRLVCKWAKTKWYYLQNKLSGIELIDLAMEGVIGLNHAAEMFDPTRGFKFSTYASWWIRATIDRAVINKGKLIRLPVHADNKRREIQIAQSTFDQQYGRKPTIDELVDLVEMSSNEIQQILNASGGAVSLNQSKQGKEEDGDEIIESLQNETDIDPLLIHVSIKERERLREKAEKIREIIKQLPFEYQVNISCRLGLFGMPNMTLQEVADAQGVTRERIRQIESFILNQIGGDSETTREYLKVLFGKLQTLDEILG